MSDAPGDATPLAERLHRDSVKARVFGRSIGTRLGRYVVLEKLGEGGTGAVFVAHDPTLERKVAIKLLSYAPPAGGDAGTPPWAETLEQEARAMARLSHPNVVHVYEVGEREGQRYLVMELVEGTTLRTWQARAHERLGPRRAVGEIVSMYAQAGRGLAAAHRAGLVHRDFKPDNVLVDDDGRARVCDFGLARVLDAGLVLATLPEGLVHRLGAAGSHRTAMVGTPAYMAPEQLRGEAATDRSDQFAFCVALLEALEGERPFAGRTPAEIFTNVLDGRRRPPAKGGVVPSWLRRACERGLASDPRERWPAMDALVEALVHGRRRARVRMGLATVGVLAGVGVGVSAYHGSLVAQRTAACEASGDEIELAWSPERAQDLHAALLATEVSHAAVTASAVTPWLDRQAAAWRSARVEACLDASVRNRWNTGQLERSSWCLDERRAELQSLVDELSRADAAAVSMAVPAAAALASVEPCRDERVLALLTAPPADQEAIRAVRADVVRATVRERAGRHAAGLELARAALTRAEALGWRPLIASARLSLGRLLARTGDHASAEAALEEAYFEAAEDGGAPHTVVDSATALVFVVGYRAGRHADGRRWGRLANVLLADLPDAEGLRRAILLEYLADIDMATAGHDEARARYEHALAVLERALGHEHPDVAHGLTLLAGAERELGRHDRAQPLLERALGIEEATLGAEHPRVAATLTNLAHVHGDLGLDAEARVLHERALAIHERTLGPDHPSVARAAINLANFHYARGAYDAAIERYGRAVAILERVLGPDHVDVALGLGNLANAHLATGDHEQARVLHERVLAIEEHALGTEHPAVARSLGNLAAVHQAAGAHERAGALHERALAILERTLGPDHPDVAQGLYNLATVRFAQGASEEARTLHERALAILERALGPDHADVAYSVMALAEVSLAQERPREAVSLARRALAIRERADAPSEPLATARFVLAKALWAAQADGDGDRAQAVSLALQARDALAREGEGSATALTEVQAWLDARAGAR